MVHSFVKSWGVPWIWVAVVCWGNLKSTSRPRCAWVVVAWFFPHQGLSKCQNTSSVTILYLKRLFCLSYAITLKQVSSQMSYFSFFGLPPEVSTCKTHRNCLSPKWQHLRHFCCRSIQLDKRLDRCLRNNTCTWWSINQSGDLLNHLTTLEMYQLLPATGLVFQLC